MLDLVRVHRDLRVHCIRRALRVHAHRGRAEEELREPWTDRDLKSLGVYSTCAKCGHSFTRWLGKKKIEAENKKDEKAYLRLKKRYQEKLRRGEKANPPKLNQQPLQMQCCCIQVGASFYGGISCGLCKDGSCEICLCPCSFAVKISNYNCVLADRYDKENKTKKVSYDERTDSARDYLNGALKLKESFQKDASNEYTQLQKEGKLSAGDVDGIKRSIDHQAALSTSNFLCHNPPGHGAKRQLRAHMQQLEHRKGPTWIRHHGKDVNLAANGAERREKNNRLAGVCELNSDGDEVDDDEVELIEAKKPAAKRPDSFAIDPDVDKVKRLRKACQDQIDFETDFDDLDKKEKKQQERHMKAMRWYGRALKENSCKEVTGMLVDGEEEWERGQSQDMHQQIINTRAYEY